MPIKKLGESVHIPGLQEPLDAVELDGIHTYVGQKTIAGAGHGVVFVR